MATAKLLEAGNTAPKLAQLGGKFQTKLSGLRVEICAAQSARKMADVKCNMTRANLITLERNLRAESAKDGKIIVLSSEKKEANLMKMAGVMTKLQVDWKEKDKRCHVLEKALDDHSLI